MTVKLDIKANSRVIQDRNGFRAERVAHLYDDDPATIIAVEALPEALQDPAIPSLGDVHPEIAGIYLVSKEVTAASKGIYRIDLVYADDPGYPGSLNDGKRASATLTSKPARTGYLGVRFTADYVSVADQNNDPQTTTTENFTAQVEKPRAEFEFSYTSATFPKTDIDTYLGTINLNAWNGYAAETVLCTAWNVQQRGDDWDVSVSFSYDPDGWDFTAVAAVPPSQIISSTTPGFSTTTGEISFQVYEPRNFDLLGFTL